MLPELRRIIEEQSEDFKKEIRKYKKGCIRLKNMITKITEMKNTLEVINID